MIDSLATLQPAPPHPWRGRPRNHIRRPAPAFTVLGLTEILMDADVPEVAIFPWQLDPGREDPPTHALMRAVLSDAVSLLPKVIRHLDGKHGQAHTEELLRWFTDADGPHLFSFGAICQVLNLQPDWIREGVLNWIGRLLAQEAGWKKPQFRHVETPGARRGRYGRVG